MTEVTTATCVSGKHQSKESAGHAAAADAADAAAAAAAAADDDDDDDETMEQLYLHHHSICKRCINNLALHLEDDCLQVTYLFTVGPMTCLPAGSTSA
jgi:hypothetical protein